MGLNHSFPSFHKEYWMLYAYMKLDYCSNELLFIRHKYIHTFFFFCCSRVWTQVLTLVASTLPLDTLHPPMIYLCQLCLIGIDMQIKNVSIWIITAKSMIMSMKTVECFNIYMYTYMYVCHINRVRLQTNL
jgi:hypothetical protein